MGVRCSSVDDSTMFIDKCVISQQEGTLEVAIGKHAFGGCLIWLYLDVS